MRARGFVEGGKFWSFELYFWFFLLKLFVDFPHFSRLASIFFWNNIFFKTLFLISDPSLKTKGINIFSFSCAKLFLVIFKNFVPAFAQKFINIPNARNKNTKLASWFISFAFHIKKLLFPKRLKTKELCCAVVEFTPYFFGLFE